jgi:DNA polymerase elongation subunit (family B)
MNDFYTNVSCIGNNILFKGIKNGKKIKTKIPYSPSLYVVSNKKTSFKNLEGQFLEEMSFDSIREARDFVEQYKEVENFKIFGNNRYEYDFISKSFPTIIEWDRDKIHVVNLDIEVGSENGFPNPDSASEPITAIACKFSQSENYYILGCGEYKKHKDNIIYYRCNDEYELVEKFLQLWGEKSPDIITGWNVKTFDMPYLVNRIRRLFDDNKTKLLSPWGLISERTTTVMTREIKYYEFVGISILDYLEMYRKFNTNGTAESFRLDHIANVELGERKLSYSEYDNLHELYRLDFQKFIEYNQKDVELVERLDEKLKLLDLALTLAYDSKTNYPDVFMQVRMWTEIIQNHLRSKNIFLEVKRRDVNRTAFEGAFVKDPIVGMHEWVASFDLTSLYPSLIMMYNISPDTIIDASKYSSAMRQCSVNVEKLLDQRIDTIFLKDEKVCMTPNNQFFSLAKKGFLPEIMESMFIDRQKYKKEMLSAQKEYEAIKSQPEKEDVKKLLTNKISRFNNLQIAKKVSLNSGYGAIGSPYFFLFDVRQAEGITSAGQLAIRWIEKKINEYMNKVLKTENKDYVIASDTDSIYLNMSGLVNSVYKNKDADTSAKIKFMDRVCNEKIQPFIDSAYGELGDYINCFSQKMIMKREALADKGIWVAKKRYILNVYNNEGVQYDKPKLKIMGIEAIKSSTPASCRTKIIEALNLILRSTESEVQQFIENFRNEFRTLPVEDISFPRSVNGVNQYSDTKDIFKKGTPIHVRGSLIFNHTLQKLKLEKKYQKIREGEKIKFVYLKEPNKFGSHVISFLNSVPKEFDISKFIDYDTQFDKSFVEPLKLILDKINWKVEKISTLEDFFA